MGFEHSYEFIDEYCADAVMEHRTMWPNSVLSVDLLLFVMQALYSANYQVRNNPQFIKDTVEKIKTQILHVKQRFWCSEVRLYVDHGPRERLKRKRKKGTLITGEDGSVEEIGKFIHDIVVEFRNAGFVASSEGEAEVAMVRDADERSILWSDDSDLLHLCQGRNVGAIYRYSPSSRSRVLFDPSKMKCIEEGSPELNRFFILLKGTDYVPPILTGKRLASAIAKLRDDVPLRKTLEERLVLAANSELNDDVDALFRAIILQTISLCRHEPKAKTIASITEKMKDDCMLLIRLFSWQYKYSTDLQPPNTAGLVPVDVLKFPMVSFYATLLSIKF